MTAAEVSELIAWARAVHVAPTIEDYAVALAQATRAHSDLRLGASPRATLQLVRAAKVWAALDGRGFVIPDDITALLIPVFAHRLIPTRSAAGSRTRSGADTVTTILERIAQSVRVPIAATHLNEIRRCTPEALRGRHETPVAVHRARDRRPRARDRRASSSPTRSGIVELMYFGVLLVGVLVAGCVSLHLVRRPGRVTRSLSPDVGTVGRPATVVARVGVRSPFPTAPGTWDDSLPTGVTGIARGAFPAVGSGFRGGDKVVELEYTITGARRGIHSIGPLTVTTSDPFGLTRRRTVFSDRTKVTIAPAVIDLSALTNLLGDAGGTLHSQTNQLGQGADNLVARPYVSGDSMRRIHWRASAHRGDLMVRQEEQESTPDAVVVLDEACCGSRPTRSRRRARIRDSRPPCRSRSRSSRGSCTTGTPSTSSTPTARP